MFYETILPTGYGVTEPIIDVSLVDFRGRGEARDKKVVYSRVSTFRDKDDKELFSKVRKLAFLESFVKDDVQG